MSQCKHCDASATQFIHLKSGEDLALCLDCYNAWYCKKAGYDINLCSHPKTMAVNGKRYKLMKRAFFGGMQYWAYAGRADNPNSFQFNGPFTMSGKQAVKQLAAIIAEHTDSRQKEDALVPEHGVISIVPARNGYDDADFLVNGKRYTGEQLIDYLSMYMESNFRYVLESRVPSPECEWYMHEEDIFL